MAKKWKNKALKEKKTIPEKVESDFGTEKNFPQPSPNEIIKESSIRLD